MSADFTVTLEKVFHGPLDLLLHLVKDKELEIHAVSLATVCDEYCAHVKAMDEVEIDEAAEYLVTAATLVAIKSRSLLPKEELVEEEDAFDPGEELVRQLLAYKALRETAEWLGAQRAERRLRLGGGMRHIGQAAELEGSDLEDEEDVEWELGDVSLWDLLRIFRRLEEETGFNRPHKIRPKGRSLRSVVQEVWRRLLEVSETTLHALWMATGAKRSEAAYYLVALLELAKQRTVNLEQAEPFGDISVIRRDDGRELELDKLDRTFAAVEHGGTSDTEIGDLLDAGSSL